jgi:low temperature requirement protein LtrA
MGYFAIIWFTWFQNTLFDVRFSNDSAFERMCKVMQFGIMTGFAVTGPGYITDAPTTEQQNSSLHAFQALSLILMSSRLILAFQYSVAFWWIRSYKKARWPMLAHIGVLLASATVFLGLYFGFQLHGNENVLAGWYVVVALEALTILIISGKVRFLSFRRTVLVERLGLLTLIILGEGIIDMCTSINSIGSDDSYTSDIIGMIICSVATIYSMWMLYFGTSFSPSFRGSV